MNPSFRFVQCSFSSSVATQIAAHKRIAHVPLEGWVVVFREHNPSFGGVSGLDSIMRASASAYPCLSVLAFMVIFQFLRNFCMFRSMVRLLRSARTQQIPFLRILGMLRSVGIFEGHRICR